MGYLYPSVDYVWGGNWGYSSLIFGSLISIFYRKRKYTAPLSLLFFLCAIILNWIGFIYYIYWNYYNENEKRNSFDRFYIAQAFI